MKTVKINSYAKINVGLKILNKRSPVNISKDEPLKPIILKNLY